MGRSRVTGRRDGKESLIRQGLEPLQENAVAFEAGSRPAYDSGRHWLGGPPPQPDDPPRRLTVDRWRGELVPWRERSSAPR